MPEYNQDWADFIVKHIENNLEYLKDGEDDRVNFGIDKSMWKGRFNNNKIKDTELFCVYLFAESYFFANMEDIEDVGDVPINIAINLLKECVEKLKRGEKIDNPEVLEYAKYQYTMIDHLKKRILSLFHRK